FQLGFNMSGSVDNENAFYIDVKGSEAGSSPNTIRINSYDNGVFSTLNSAILPFMVEKDTWYQVVVKREGASIKAKMWPFDEGEPEEFQVITSKSNSVLDHGGVGVGKQTNGTTNDWAYFSVGTGG